MSEVVGSLLITDRYLSYGIGEAIPSKNTRKLTEVNFDIGETKRLMFKDKSGTELEAKLREALENLTSQRKDITSISIGCCAPLKLSYRPYKHLKVSKEFIDKDEKLYGVIADNKLFEYWSGVNLYEIASDVMDVPGTRIFIRSDVGLAALAEFYYRLNNNTLADQSLRFRNTEDDRAVVRDTSTLAFIKLSSEINAGIVTNGTLLKGRNHPVLSIVKPRLMSEGGRFDNFKGACPIHDTCFHGLISEQALIARLQEAGLDTDLNALPAGHPIWDILAYYTAQLCIMVAAICSPSMIVLGGRLVTDYLTDGLPDNDIVRKVNELTRVGLRDLPYLPDRQRVDGYVQAQQCEGSALYGGIVYAYQQIHPAAVTTANQREKR